MLTPVKSVSSCHDIFCIGSLLVCLCDCLTNRHSLHCHRQLHYKLHSEICNCGSAIFTNITIFLQ